MRHESDRVSIENFLRTNLRKFLRRYWWNEAQFCSYILVSKQPLMLKHNCKNKNKKLSGYQDAQFVQERNRKKVTCSLIGPIRPALTLMSWVSWYSIHNATPWQRPPLEQTRQHSYQLRMFEYCQSVHLCRTTAEHRTRCRCSVSTILVFLLYICFIYKGYLLMTLSYCLHNLGIRRLSPDDKLASRGNGQYFVASVVGRRYQWLCLPLAVHRLQSD